MRNDSRSSGVSWRIHYVKKYGLCKQDSDPTRHYLKPRPRTALQHCVYNKRTISRATKPEHKKRQGQPKLVVPQQVLLAGGCLYYSSLSAMSTSSLDSSTHSTSISLPVSSSVNAIRQGSVNAS